MVAALQVGGLAVGCALSGPRWSGEQSTHVEGENFFTPDAPQLIGSFEGFKNFLKWQTSRERGPWKPYREEPFGPPQLIQLDGVNVLTDPMYSRRCSRTSIAGPERVRPPHNHSDHLDLPTLERIAATWPRALIFAGLGNKAYLARRGIEGLELDWWDSRPVGDVAITSVPNQHFLNRGLSDADGGFGEGLDVPLEQP